MSTKSGAVPPEQVLWIEVHGTLRESIDDFKAGVKRMLAGREGTHRSYSMHPEHLRAFLASERFRLVQLIRDHEPGSIYALAKLAGRDRMAVTMDLRVLEGMGFVRMRRGVGPGRPRHAPFVPYKAIRIAIDL